MLPRTVQRKTLSEGVGAKLGLPSVYPRRASWWSTMVHNEKCLCGVSRRQVCCWMCSCGAAGRAYVYIRASVLKHFLAKRESPKSSARACMCSACAVLKNVRVTATNLGGVQALHVGEFLLIQCMKCVDVSLRAAGKLCADKNLSCVPTKIFHMMQMHTRVHV